VTEQEWLASREPRAMLTFLLGRGKATDRKVRLFGCACCRLIWDLFPDARNRDMVLAIEDHPDGAFSDPDLDEAICASSLRESELSSNPVYWIAKYLGRGFYKLTAGASALTVAFRAAATTPEGPAREAHLAEQTDRLRDIFGPLPFRPVTVHPHVLGWNDRLVVHLAQAIYDERRWGGPATPARRPVGRRVRRGGVSGPLSIWWRACSGVLGPRRHTRLALNGVRS
jgi:hypothetical protein